jgi:hypothetical protein
MSEISPCDERDSAFPSQDDVESVLASLALIQKNAGVASKYIRTGEYDHRDLRQAINDIREGVQIWWRNSPHDRDTWSIPAFPELDEK